MRTHWLVALALNVGVVAASDLSCTALVYDQTGSDLYLGDAAGTPLTRLTNDGRTKFGASLSPRGDYASFVYEKSNTEIQVVSRDGNMRTLVIDDRFDHMGAPLIATQWDSESLVMVQFYGHANSLFQWVGVGKGVAPSSAPNGAAGSELRMSTYCASAPQGRHVACVAGDGVLIDDRSGISIDSFEDGRTIGAFDVAEGEKTTVPGYEGASFTVIRVRPEGTSYRAGLGDSQPEIFLPDNDGGLVERIGDST